MMVKENKSRLSKIIQKELTCVVFIAGHEFVESPLNLESLCREGNSKFYFGGQYSLKHENVIDEIIQ